MLSYLGRRLNELTRPEAAPIPQTIGDSPVISQRFTQRAVPDGQNFQRRAQIEVSTFVCTPHANKCVAIRHPRHLQLPA